MCNLVDGQESHGRNPFICMCEDCVVSANKRVHGIVTHYLRIAQQSLAAEECFICIGNLNMYACMSILDKRATP